MWLKTSKSNQRTNRGKFFSFEKESSFLQKRNSPIVSIHNPHTRKKKKVRRVHLLKKKHDFENQNEKKNRDENYTNTNVSAARPNPNRFSLLLKIWRTQMYCFWDPRNSIDIKEILWHGADSSLIPDTIYVHWTLPSVIPEHKVRS